MNGIIIIQISNYKSTKKKKLDKHENSFWASSRWSWLSVWLSQSWPPISVTSSPWIGPYSRTLGLSHSVFIRDSNQKKNRKSFKTLNFRTKKIMSAEVATNNNPNRLDGESKMKYEKLKKQLETPIETRINVNFCLLVYWLPGSLWIIFMVSFLVEKSDSKNYIIFAWSIYKHES